MKQVTDDNSLLDDLRRQSFMASTAHYYMAKRYDLFTRYISACLLLSSTTLTTIIIFEDKIGNFFSYIPGYVITILALIITALALIQSTSNFQYMSAQHRQVAEKYGALKRRIDRIEVDSSFNGNERNREVDALIGEMFNIVKESPSVQEASIRFSESMIEKDSPYNRASAELNKSTRDYR